MKKTLFLWFSFLIFLANTNVKSQDLIELAVGPRFQKTQKLYWENGVTADFTSGFLLRKKVHVKMSYVSSRLGTAFKSNAIKQDNFLIGADWRFRSSKAFQIFAGLNTGYFHADMENEIFEDLPHNSMLFSFEAGLFHRFKFPLAVSLSAGYNLISGNGVDSPGTLFPVYYQMSLLYYIKK